MDNGGCSRIRRRLTGNQRCFNEHDSLEKDDSVRLQAMFNDWQNIHLDIFISHYANVFEKHLSFIDVNCDFIIIVINLQSIHLEEEM